MSEEEDRMGEMVMSRVWIMRDEVFPEYSHADKTTTEAPGWTRATAQ